MAPKATSTDEAKRLNFALPAEYGPMLDKVGERISAAVKQVAGVAFVPSKVDIVKSLIEDAVTQQGNGDAPTGE